MNVLSLFDGMSCGQIALNRAGIHYDNYFASEIDKHAIKVTQNNYPNTIQLGDVTKIDVSKLPKIDLLIGGSPCQGFSLAGKGLNFEDERSKLFFEYLRILKDIQCVNPNVKFLLENVKMKKEFVEVINNFLGVNGIFINSNLVSAQNRPRWYWTNIGDIEQPKDKGVVLSDVLQDDVDFKYYIKGGRLDWLNKFGEVKEKDGYISFNPNKAKCLTVRSEPSWNTAYIVQRPHGFNKGGLRAIDGKTPAITASSWENDNPLVENFVRKLTPIECERLQTVPDNYTECVSDSQRYKMLGNGWTVDVIVHIFKHLKEGGSNE